MADLPILFSAPMVRAILDGRKTQTRRIIKDAGLMVPPYNMRPRDGMVPVRIDEWGAVGYKPTRIVTGDRLYVREHWRTSGSVDTTPPRDLPRSAAIVFEADGFPAPEWRGKHRQAMHMPKWASRITLIVEGVKIERLQDISEQDCVAEGIEFVTRTSSGNFYRNFDAPEMPMMAYGAYRSLWNHINGAGAWDANPWVVAYTFRPIFQNIDQIARAA